MGPLFPIVGAIALAHAAYKYLTQESAAAEPEWFVGVGWSGAITGNLPPSVVRPILHHHLTSQGKYGRADPKGGDDRYFRGDATITQVPCARPVRWIDLPMYLEVGYSGDATSCEIAIKFLAWEGVRFSKPNVDFFHEHAADELDSFLQVLREYSPPPEPPRRERPRSESTNESDSDLALLGLKRGATWGDVQAAYRDACLKYHPDRLSGVPPHMVELGVQRFREVTEAYQRLKSRLG